jgi:hypothetical protein
MAPTALLSVSDKAGLVSLANGLLSHGYQLLSSGGTATALAAGISLSVGAGSAYPARSRPTTTASSSSATRSTTECNGSWPTSATATTK